MRGKLRDKRTDSSPDHIKREQTERRRPPKRGSRPTIRHLQQLEEDSLLEDEDVQLVGSRKKQK